MTLIRAPAIRDYPDLLGPVVDHLPFAQQPTLPVQLSICVRDGACRFSAGEVMQEALKKVDQAEVFTVDELEKLEERYAGRRGW